MQELTKTFNQDKIQALENELLKLPQEKQQLRHFTDVDGIYMREMIILKGMATTGKVHVTESYSIITKGKVAIVNNFGDEVIMQAGDILYSAPGGKKAVYALEDSIFVTVHKCDLKEIPDIENYLVVDTPEQYQLRITQQKALS